MLMEEMAKYASISRYVT